MRDSVDRQRLSRFPHPLTLLTAGILLAAALTYVVPAGEFARTLDATTNRNIVVGGTYHRVPQNPIGPLGVLLAIPRGLADAVSVIATVFLVGGAFAVVDRTGALRRGLAGLLGWLGARSSLAIPICCVAFATGGALENMQEEIIALVPVLMLLVSRLGANGLTAAAMSLGAAAVGSAFSPVNPFQVGIAQQVAEVPLFSGSAFRLAVLVLAVALWIWGTMRLASRSRTASRSQVTMGHSAGDATGPALSTARTAVVMALVIGAFAIFIVGLARFDWGFDELSAVFFAMGILAGLVGGLGATGTAEAYVDGFKDMAFAALLIGFARGIFVVLNDGHVIDTIVNGLFTPLAGLPTALAALGMIGVQTAVHVAVPSVSGQAVLTMPVLVPLSDLLGISRQVTILCYQYGAGLCELLTPTNGALMAVLAAAGVRFEDWIRFVLPMWGLLIAVGAIAVLVALAIGLA